MSIPAPTPALGAPLSDEFGGRPTTYASGAPWPTVMAGHLDWIAEHQVREPRGGTPLVSVLSAFVDRAAASLVVDPALLAAPAVGQLQRWLLDRLASLSGRVLELERRAYRAAQGTALHHLITPTGPEDDFAAHLLGGGLPALAREYPTWARLVTELMTTWRASVDELVTRLAEDRPLIGERLCGGVRLGPVTHLLSGASDPHDGGRSVIMIGFASGDVVVYKPRDLRPEAAFATVARWLADRGAPAGPRPLAVVERDGYGWMEFARPDPCRTTDDVATFYRRAGALLALVYALCGTDAHHENLVASGSWPALVDAETLLHTVPRRTRRPDAVSEARAILNDSVFGTAMLPIWRRLADGDGYDNSGLGVGRPQRRGVKPEIPVLANVPRLEGVPIAADDHVTEIVDGFTAMYAAILAHRDELAAADGPLAQFRSARMRIVLRPSQLYGDLIDSALRPAALRDGAHHWRALRRSLAAPPAAESGQLAVADRSVLRAELDALEHLDIPRFTAYADRPEVAGPPRLAGQATGTEPGLDRVRARLAVLGEDDLRRQVSFIRGAFHCRAATGTGTDPDLLRVRSRPGPRQPVETPSEGSTLIAQETAVRMATGIASRIHDLAIRGADGSVTWIVPAFEHGGGYRLRPMGLDLYSGTAGVGMFLAALRRVTGEEAHAALAQAAIQGMTQLADRRHAAGFPLGGLHGLGSAIYTLVNLADLLGSPDLLDTARAIARTLDRDAVDRDTAYDLTHGSAGAVLALLALARATDDDEPMTAARRCADHLVRAGTRTPADPLGRLTGCAHGAAGMAHALSRMAEATGDRRYEGAAGELIAYEDGTFDHAVGSWPDLRRDAPAGSFMFGWCNGAPGIGLARLSATALLPRATEDVAIAARATVTAGRGRRDNLCCGNLGRAAFLAAAGEHRHDHSLSAAAASLIREVVEDADRTGAFALVNDPRAQADHLGFFQGAAGIGFQLLRFAFPGQLPSPLLIE